MDYYSMTDKALMTELGTRIKSLRLRKNLTQQELSQRTVLSLNTIKSLEEGKGKITTLIAVLRELKALDGIDNFIPEVTISPIQLSKMRGKKRKRATGSRGKKDDR